MSDLHLGAVREMPEDADIVCRSCGALTQNKINGVTTCSICARRMKEPIEGTVCHECLGANGWHEKWCSERDPNGEDGP